MSAHDLRPHSPRFYKLVVLGQVFALVALVGIGSFVYGQSRTQDSICRLIRYTGDRTQQQITTASTKLQLDKRRGDDSSVALDRQSIGGATAFLIRIRSVC